MPIAAAHPLDDVIEATTEHAQVTGLAPMWAVTLLDGINDGDDDAAALAELAGRFRQRTGLAPRLSVIAYNRIDADDRDPFRPSSPERTAAFRDTLAAAGIRTHRRYSGGSDIAAACGQLAAHVDENDAYRSLPIERSVAIGGVRVGLDQVTPSPRETSEPGTS